MNSVLRKCCAILLVFLALCGEMNVTAAGSRGAGTTNNQTYEVLARSNMRAQPSLDGTWIMTVPQGAVVIGLDSDDGEFCRIIYEDVEGYIYSGCLRLITDLQVIEEEPQALEEAAVWPLEPAAQSLPEAEEPKEMRLTGENLGLSSLVQSRLGSGETVRVNVVSNANLRGAPSIEGRQILVVPKEASVVFLDEGENGYTHISYQGQSGYIYTRLLDLGELGIGDNSGIAQSVTIPEVQGVAETVNNNSSSTVLASQRGIANVGNITTQISVEVEEVAASNMIEVQMMTAQAGTVSSAIDISKENISYEISNRANMRMSPSVDGSWITTLPVGADVVKLGETTDGYTMVQYNGIVGYVLENCITDKVDISRLGTEPVLFTVTAYCPCRICCGNYSPEVTGRESHTATGTVPQAGRTIAVDPRIIPYGTSVHIDGMGDYIAEDCGGSVRQNHIDIYFETHEAAVAFGTKRLYVTINR